MPLPTSSMGGFGANTSEYGRHVYVTNWEEAGTNSALTPVGAPSTTDVQSVQGFGYRSEVPITRPANTTPYTANDAYGPASAILTFADIGPSGGHIFITDVMLRIDLPAIPAGMTSFRLYLYDIPPTAIADNAAWDLIAGDRAAFRGFIDLGSPADLGSTLFVQTTGVNRKIKLAAGSTSLYGVLVTAGAFTPTSAETSAVTLHSVGI